MMSTPTVEQVITDDTYTVAIHLADDVTVTVSAETAEALAYDLTEAALEPVRCFDPSCHDYAAPGEDNCPRHLTDADDDLPDYADWRQA